MKYLDQILPHVIQTNQGDFQVRFICERWNPRWGNINIIVVSSQKPANFTGEYGDEIPMLSTYYDQFGVKNFPKESFKQI